MLSDEITTGSITSTLAEKKAFALKSHAYNLTEKKFRVCLPHSCLDCVSRFVSVLVMLTQTAGCDSTGCPA